MESLSEVFIPGSTAMACEDGNVPEAQPDSRAESLASDPIERRLQTRAYRHWLSQIADDEIPAVEDLRPAELDAFGPVGVLVDLTLGAARPSIAYLGERLARECGVGEGIFMLHEVPRYSLLSNLTEHCLEVVARRAPLGFEADLATPGELRTLYRSILLPYSSDGSTVDFVFGVISWKHQGPAADCERAA